MLIDLDLATKSVDTSQYDVCISGSGPAGITLALTLAKKGKRVAIFEGGGLEYTEQSQDVYRGKTTESVGINYWENISNCRLRFMGGTSNHWTGMCGYYEEADLTREMNGLPAWPITRQDMFQYFEETKVVLDLPSNAFVEKKWSGSNFEQYNRSYSPPTRFRTKYLDELKASTLIDLYIHASLTDINLDDKNLDQINHLEISNNKLNKFHFKAKQYVLAMGAIENARMLLASNKQISTGIGNQSDMVGRCFMEHLNVRYGKFVAEPNQVWVDNEKYITIKPSADFAKSKNIASGVITFSANTMIDDYGRTAALKKQLRSLVCQSDSVTEFARQFKDFDCDGDGLVSSMIEQSPNLDSRVKLDPTETDMFGNKRVALDWRLNEFDLKTIRTIGLEASKELAKLGYARVQLAEPILDKQVDMDEIAGHCHQMGTTRMSTDPKYGVVDANSKVHGMKNLYIAGSSVYSTGSFCNPTFTIVMLALRLGNHLLEA